jgi:hypothetical protein
MLNLLYNFRQFLNTGNSSFYCIYELSAILWSYMQFPLNARMVAKVPLVPQQQNSWPLYQWHVLYFVLQHILDH